MLQLHDNTDNVSNQSMHQVSSTYEHEREQSSLHLDHRALLHGCCRSGYAGSRGNADRESVLITYLQQLI